ncbi:MAG: Uroporphyrinogen deCOase protein [Candidatus Poribacteria bacterium]|nr:Uroporphyrinogen deCOase protein [Candidatus Poribacteria bacterium]
MGDNMTNKERIMRMLNFEKVDRVPILGGFIVSGKHYRGITGVTRDVFFNDPAKYAIEAYHKLGVDGLILLRLPSENEGHLEYRFMTKEGFESYKQRYQSPEDVLNYAESLPSPMEALKNFDAKSWKGNLAKNIKDMQQKMGDIVWLPTQWDVVHPTFELYNYFGYENYMQFLALYPDASDKLFGSEVEVKRRISSIIVEVYKELDVIPLIHVGTDICGKNGPVASPEFLRKHYFPHVCRSIEPLVEAGFKTVWHADGYVTPIIDDILDCGISGLQGFQWEYDVKLEDIVKKRTQKGEKLTIMAGSSVTVTLPFGTKEDVRKEIEYIIGTAKDKCALFYLPANDILPDTPVENLVEAHRHAINYGSAVMR